jgi:tetratricopeptide (TPR) repeat protein
MPPPSHNQGAEAERLMMQQRFPEALACAEAWVAAAPHDWRPYDVLARIHFAVGRLRQSIEAIDRALTLQHQNPPLQLLRAVCDHRLGRSDEAIARLRKLIERRPPNVVEASVALAEALHRAGRADELEEFLAKGEAWLSDPRAALFRARLEARADRRAATDALLKSFRGASHPALKRVAGFEAVRLLDADGRYTEALAVASNVHRETTPRFDLASMEREFEAMHRFLDGVERDHAEKGALPAQTAGVPSVEKTALVVGLPRSGTTLLEQMLDRHPTISGIGEYEGTWEIRQGLAALGTWPDRLSETPVDAATNLARVYLEGADARRRSPGTSPAASWTFDKSLYQWRLLPALGLVLPGAAFINIERDARDCAISMHLSNFHPKSWGFTADLASIRRVIELERALVPRAIEVLGLRAIKVRYEDLVAEPEAVLRRVLAFLGLPFDPCVLAPEENRRTVLTLSFEQVRRPINTSAIGRWKKYASAFDASWESFDAGRDASSPT